MATTNSNWLTDGSEYVFGTEDKVATGNVLTFLSPYSNIPYGKKSGRYQGLEFCRRIITRVTEESMWQR